MPDFCDECGGVLDDEGIAAVTELAELLTTRDADGLQAVLNAVAAGDMTVAQSAMALLRLGSDANGPLYQMLAKARRHAQKVAVSA